MGQLQKTIEHFTGEYNFDVTGGAVGSYDLSVPIPQNAVVKSFGFVVLVGLVHGIGTTISFDAIIIGVSPVVTSVGYFVGAAAATAFHIPTEIHMGIAPTPQAPLLDGSGITTSGQFNSAISVGFSIGVLPITAGRLMFWADCIMFDLPQ